MYQINDIVIYENGGIFQISAIGKLDFLKSEVCYYTLQSLEPKGSTIYVKQDNESLLRRPISEEEALAHISSVCSLNTSYDDNNKLRDREYAEVIKTGSCRKRLEMMKAIEAEKARRAAVGKNLTGSDEKNLQKVENLVFSEFSIVLGISKDEVRRRILYSVE